jgi:hypothetical protein
MDQRCSRHGRDESDIQADIARELIAAGVGVWISNHRSVTGILDYIRRLGAIVGAAGKAGTLAREAEQHIAQVNNTASRLLRRARRCPGAEPEVHVSPIELDRRLWTGPQLFRTAVTRESHRHYRLRTLEANLFRGERIASASA